MRPASRADLLIAAVVCGVIGLGDVLYVAATLSGRPTIGPALNGLFPDFLVFYAATQAYLEGKLALVYDSAAFTQFQNTLFFPGHLLQPLHFRPFFYPPTWLLMLLPFGLLGLTKAYGVFMALTAAAATASEGRRDRWGWLAVVTSPAAVWVVLAGQNTFLSAALLYAGLRLLDRSPAAAGVLLGVLSYKPQVWVLVPLALLAARQWHTLLWTIGTVATMSLLSLAAFGFDFWLAFVEASREAVSAPVVDEMFQRFFMHMTTLLAAARIAGLPPALAAVIQLGGAALSIAAVWLAFRRPGNGEARIAVLVTATFLVSPYTLNYDLLLLMPAAVALFRQATVAGFYPLERLVYPILWLIPTACWVLNQIDLPITPLVVLAFGAIAWMRLQAQPKVELPSAVTAG
jgi:alpha-1,2-mannosyltransferase